MENMHEHNILAVDFCCEEPGESERECINVKYEHLNEHYLVA